MPMSDPAPASRPEPGVPDPNKRRSTKDTVKVVTVAVTLVGALATVAQLFVAIKKPTEPEGTASEPAALDLQRVFEELGRTEVDTTVPGRSICNPDADDRPFVIEWDATDMSSFEFLAADNIVFVAYDGCELQVLDACRNDSLRGALGVYNAPTWTSGSLETLDIHDEAELRTKLPLGHSSLGQRVAAGEQFHMEYFVAGTVNATRSAVYRDDLASYPGCAKATHFVYGYNLGAFALGSTKGVDTEAGASMFGFGTEGTRSKGRTADKRGGDLSACRTEARGAVQGCRTPIRLNLRPIEAGPNPAGEAMTAPDDQASLNAAGQINARIDASETAARHIRAASDKLLAGDGIGCLAELDAHDALEPQQLSTDPRSHYAPIRVQCLMLAGQCEAGKLLARSYSERLMPESPDGVDANVEGYVVNYCRGSDMSPRDQLLQAEHRIRMAHISDRAPEAQFCHDEWRRAKEMLPKVETTDPDNPALANIKHSLWKYAPACFARVGDCKQAFRVYVEMMPQKMLDFEADKAEAGLRKNFEKRVEGCGTGGG